MGHIVKNEDVVLREIHSVYFLINAKEKYWQTKAIVKVNEVGKAIWQSLDKALDFDNLVDIIIAKFNIMLPDVETVKQDIEYYLNNLHEVGYIRYEQ